MTKIRVLSATLIASAALVGWTQTAQATTTPSTGGGAPAAAGSAAAVLDTPLGTISAAQVKNLCDENGAQVRVTIANGYKSAEYTVLGTGFLQRSKTVTVNAAGAATIDLHDIRVSTRGSVGNVGTATIMISSTIFTVAVQAQIACPIGQKG